MESSAKPSPSSRPASPDREFADLPVLDLELAQKPSAPVANIPSFIPHARSQGWPDQAPSSPAAPEIHVSIGAVEVRANVSSSPPAPRRPGRAVSPPKLSDYLRRRAGKDAA